MCNIWHRLFLLCVRSLKSVNPDSLSINAHKKDKFLAWTETSSNLSCLDNCHGRSSINAHSLRIAHTTIATPNNARPLFSDSWSTSRKKMQSYIQSTSEKKGSSGGNSNVCDSKWFVYRSSSAEVSAWLQKLVQNPDANLKYVSAFVLKILLKMPK